MSTIDSFDYELPDERIAQVPLAHRDQSRLLRDRGTRAAEHRYVFELAQLLEPGDLVVVNNTKVLPARIHAVRPTGGATEVLLLEPDGPPVTALSATTSQWEVLVKPSKKPHQSPR